MLHAVLINHQHPLRAVTSEPSRGRLDLAASYEVIAVSELIRVIIIRRKHEPLA